MGNENETHMPNFSQTCKICIEKYKCLNKHAKYKPTVQKKKI